MTAEVVARRDALRQTVVVVVVEGVAVVLRSAAEQGVAVLAALGSSAIADHALPLSGARSIVMPSIR